MSLPGVETAVQPNKHFKQFSRHLQPNFNSTSRAPGKDYSAYSMFAYLVPKLPNFSPHSLFCFSQFSWVQPHCLFSSHALTYHLSMTHMLDFPGPKFCLISGLCDALLCLIKEPGLAHSSPSLSVLSCRAGGPMWQHGLGSEMLDLETSTLGSSPASLSTHSVTLDK